MRSGRKRQVACRAKLSNDLCVPFAFILRFIVISGYIYDDVIETVNSNRKWQHHFLHFT